MDKTAIIKLLKQSTGRKSTEISVSTPKDGLAEVLFDIATALKDNSGNEAALIFSQLALDIRPNFPAAQLFLGELYNHRSKYTQAIGKKEKIAAIETNKLVIISEFLSPIYLPKKPAIIDAINGSAIIDNSILAFKFIYFFNTNCS